MKPTSPLSLLLFIRLVTSSPVDLSHKTLSLTSCGSEGCREALAGHIAPPTRIPNPHFPDHQLSSSDSDIVIDNHPITPTFKTLPPHSLDAERPLTSAFLLALGQPASPTAPQPKEKTSKALPSKPSSELPALRKAELERYLASLSEEGIESEVLDSGSVLDGARMKHCGEMELQMLPGGYRVRQKASYVVREYSDVLVVGVVLLFLAIVIAVEAVEKCGSVRALFDRKARKNHGRHGVIFLAENEKASYNLSKPFCLSPAPLSRQNCQAQNYAEVEV